MQWKAPENKWKRYIRLKVQYNRNNLLMRRNSYARRKSENGELKTTKADTANHGIGLPSVRRAVENIKDHISRR